MDSKAMTDVFESALCKRNVAIRNLKLLTTIVTDDSNRVASLGDILRNVLNKFGDSQFVVQKGGVEIFDCYLRALVDQFSSLVQSAQSIEDDSPRALLSVGELNDVKRSIEFLVGFGVVPFLERGVVDSWKSSIAGHGSEPGRKTCFLNDWITMATKEVSSGEGQCRKTEKLQRMLLCVDTLFELWKSPPFMGLISTNFMNYLLGSLFQLSSGQTEISSVLASKYGDCLRRVIDGLYRPTILRQLIALQTPKISSDGSTKAAPPRWLISACSRILSSFLTEQKGILTFLRIFDDSGTSILNENWKQCESLATLISTRPRTRADESPMIYYENVCSQLAIDLEIANGYPKFYIILVRKIFVKCPRVVGKILLDPIFAVFRQCFDCTTALPTEQSLSRSVDHLKLLYTSSPLDETFLESLPVDIIVILLRVYANIKESPSYCRTTSKEIISVYLDNARSSSIAAVLKLWILPTADRFARFACGQTGGIRVIAEKSDFEQIDIEERIEILQQIVESLSKEGRMGMLAACLDLVDQGENCQLQSNASTSSASETMQRPYDTLGLFSVAVALMEIDPSLGNWDKKRMMELLKKLVKRNGSEIEDDNEELKSLKTQNLLLITGIIGSFCSSVLSAGHDMKEFTDLHSTLVHLSTHWDLTVRSSAKDLSFALFDSQNTSASHAEGPSTSKPGPHEEMDNLSYEQAMGELHSDLVPVRAHALIALNNLIKSRDPVACENVSLLIPALIDQLQDEDSYVYLAAVNCLVTVGLFRPNVVLPILMGLLNSTNGEQTSGVEKRLKLGEAAVKISRGLGDIAPFYGNDLINVFLSLQREADEETVASCLSNIGEICRLMSFKLNRWIDELFHCAKSLLQWDKRSLVRRSAISLLALLTQSGEEFLEVLDDLSREFYYFVKEVYERDQDDVVRLHAQLCLENIGEHAKKYIRPLIVPVE